MSRTSHPVAAPPVSIGRHPDIPGHYRLESRLWLPESPERVFAFFADAANLETLTPPWLHFRVLTPRPIDMRPGQIIDYRLRLWGVPLRWQSFIPIWEPPYRFVDEMRHGPYRSWRHLHTFESRDGGTEVFDQVDYAVPGGALVHALFVGRDLRKIFSYRLDRLRALFPAQGPASATPTPQTPPPTG